ncbi:matE family protein, partial [Vibrio parahaemolyticus EKP-028]
ILLAIGDGLQQNVKASIRWLF